MKTFLKTGKKALSVFMAVMMVLTAWVWVVPEKASAAAGSYYVKITWKCVNKRTYDNNYTGYANRGNGQCGISLFYKSNNGTGSESEVYWNIGKGTGGSTGVSNTGWMNATGTFSATATVSGFPTRVFVYSDNNYVLDESEMEVHKIEVGSSSSATLTTLWAGTAYLASSTEAYYVEFKDGTATGNHDDYAKVSTTTSNWVYPYAKTVTWSNTPEAMTCPKTASDSAATQTVAASAKDQYGVQMFDPTWKVSGNIKSTGITVSPTTSSSSTTISVTSSANILNTTNSQTGTVTATWSTPSSTNHTSVTSSKTFTINDATYTATFKNHRNADGVVQSDYTTTAQYGVTPTAPTASDYSEGDYDYTFTGWSPTVSGISADTTYTATYSDGTFVGADYSAVNEAIAAADAIKANYGTDYELKYTLASRLAIDSAINAVVTGLGRTQQTTVDGYAQVINNAIAGLEPNKFDVIFLDKDGAILLYEKDVEYKEAVTAPSYSASYYDSTNHYTFTGWDTNEYASVVDDLVIQPVFTAAAHSYTTSTVTSNCVTKGATKYTCSCGYSYIDGETDYGDHVWETEFTTDLEPTCTVAGSKSIHCTLCDAQKDITEIAPLGHQWSSQSIAVEASCGKIGIMTKVCDDCGVCEHTIIPALEHDYAESVVAPTCTTKGYTEYTCQRADCGHSYRDNYTDVVAHSYGAWETVSEAHCGVAGVKKQTCTECGHINLDSIPALVHDALDSLEWVVAVPATCEGKGYRTKTCSKCNNVIATEVISATGHNYTTTTIAATCTTAGETVSTCENCGDVNRTVIQPLGHDWNSGVETPATCTSSAYITYTCQRDGCGETKISVPNGAQANAHVWEQTSKEDATCEKDGSISYKCANCTATKTEILPKLGHSYGEWEVVTEATNDKDGQWKRVCANNEDHVEYITIPAGGHEWDNGTVTEDATCITEGKKVYTCTKHTGCGVTLEVTVPVAQHTIAQKETPATCTQPGKVEAYCSECDANCENPFSTEEIPVVPHTLDNGTAVAPTCTTSGYTTYKCTVDGCTFTYNEYDASKPATGHDYEAEETIAPDCTTEGLMTYTCACGESYTEEISATGHNYVKGETTAANCTTAGTEVYTCACGDTYTKFIEAAKGHLWSEYTETQAATADKYGIKERSCSVCGEVEIAKIAPIGDHVFTETITTPASCEAEGEKKFTCSVHTDCSANYTEKIPATGHTEKLVYVAPTCTAEGSTKIVCETCNKEIEKEEIPALYHDFSGDGVVTVEASCEGTGVKTYTCKNCDETKTEEIPAKGHSLSTTVVDAKCDLAGSVVTECTECGDPTVKVTTVLAAKGHIWGSTPTAEEAATCEADGSETYKCENCDEENVVVIPKLGHNWGEWVKVDATATADGSWSHTCSNCNETETLVIPKGHNLEFNADLSEEATCTTEGKEVYTCTNHDDCGVKIETVLPVAQHTVAQREIEATCTVEGSVEAYCSVCNAVLNTEEIPVKAHSFVAGEAVAPTCTTSGYTPYTCSCGESYNEYDEDQKATGHSLVEGASTATCNTAGVMTLSCENCSYSTTVDVPALGHDYVENVAAATEATCAAAATKTFKCSRCDAEYTISEGDKTTDHSWGGWIVKESATATSLGYQVSECSVCGQLKVETISATGEHNFNKETARNDATCTEDGSVTYACSTHTDCGLTSTITLPALGHTEKFEYKAATCEDSGYARMVCSVCDEVLENEDISALGHLYDGEGVVTQATCSAKGKVVYECSRNGCGETKTTEISINPNAHQYTTTITQPSCHEEGRIVTKCDLCSSMPVNEPLATIDHTWNGGEVKDGDAATCEADGVMTYTCTVDKCGATKTEIISKLGHNWGEWVKVDATNDKDGSWTRTCQNNADHTETVVIPKGEHSFGDTPDSTVSATCTAEGTATYNCVKHADCGVSITVTLAKVQHDIDKTEKAATCEDSGYVITKCKNCDSATFSTTIPATGHTYNDGVKTAATCTSTGKIVYTCTADGCGKTMEVTLDKLQHNYLPGEAVAPTCTASGYTPYKCADCDSNYVVITSEANGHDYSEKVSSTATCTADGVMILKCVCGATMETAVPALGHDYVLSSTAPATCAAAATETYKCSRCNDSYTVSVGSKTANHDWNDWVTVEKATNSSLGYKTRTCKICDKLEVETIPATGEHVFDFLVSEKEADCENAGEKVYSCSAHDDCGLTSTVTVPALGHKEVLEYKAATCTSEGSARMYCETCTKELKNEKIEKLEHAWSDEKVTLSTCSETGKVEFTCSYANCNETKTVEIPKDENAHKGVTVTEAATCTEDGSVITTCKLCNEELVNTPLPKLQHNWGEWVKVDATNDKDGSWTRTCDNGCKETLVIPKGNHNLVEDTAAYKAPSCTEKGEKVYKCTNHADCSVTVKVELDVVQHIFETTVNAATCEGEGSVVTKCKNCDSATITTPISATGHTYDNGVVKENATCTKEGLLVFTCTADGCGKTMEVTLAKAQHNFVAGEAVEPTCNTSGYTPYKCSVCDKAYNEYDAGKPATGHTMGAWTTVDEATCTAKGSETRKCANCDYTETRATDKLDHKYKATVTDSTCTTQGYTTYSCSVCGHSYIDNLTDALNHSYAEVKTPADCETMGYTTYSCSVCGDSYTADYVAPKGHTWGKWVVTKEATNDAEGEMTRSCSACGEVQTEVIPSGGHTFAATPDSTVAATCEAPGTETYKCTAHADCGIEKIVEIKATGHSYTAEETTAPGCTTEGVMTYTCSACDSSYTEEISATGHTYKATVVAPECEAYGYTLYECSCGDSYETAFVEPTGHTWGEWNVTKAATETEEGEKVRSCACGATETEVIPAVAHNYNDGVVTKEATCTEEGVKTFTCLGCELCNDTDGYKSYTQAVAAKGHNVSAGAKVEATCEGIGYTLYECSACDFNYIEMNSVALNHDYSVLVDTVEATCKNDGYEIYKCARCDSKKTITLEKTGEHKFVDTIVAPTCTEVGFTIKACEGCGVAYRTNFVDSLGHDITATSSEATCTEDGGITYTCSRSGCGYSEFVKDENKPALGHDMGEWYFSAQEGGKYYYNKRDCGRDECSYYEYEMVEGSETEAQKYFKVTYVNEWVATNYYVAKDGTKLAYSDAQKNGNYKTETVAEIFVKEGAAAQFPNKVYPQRYPTKEFGGYKLSWEVKSGTQSAANVTSNMVLNAVFTGYDVYYQVDFANKDGSKLTTVETILHGHGAQYPFADPTTADNLHYKYEFSHWNRDYSEIYSSGTIVAIYDEIPKTYYVFFHGINGNVISEGTFEYATKPDCTPKDMSIASDYTYHYSFVGWQLSNGKTVNVNELRVEDPAYKEYDPNLKGNTDPEVYNKYMTDAEKGIIHLYAKYNKYPIRYNVRIAAAAYDGSPVPGAVVQIIDSNNNYAGGAELNENSEYIFNLTYSKTYTVTITANNAQLTFTINGEELVKSNQNGNIPTIRVQLPEPEPGEVAGDNDCGCLCHSFLGRIYVTVFNLIYRLFGKKVVCCPDMYAAHGDDLVYS